MSDTEKEIDELQRKLAAKTRDFVAEGILDVPMQIYKAEGAGLKTLMADTVRLEHLPYFPDMSGWFNPKLARKAFAASRCVGSVRAVRRPETHCAALDPVKTGTTFDISPGEDGARGSIWIDYAADLGDGFDATICSFFTQASTARW